MLKSSSKENGTQEDARRFPPDQLLQMYRNRGQLTQAELGSALGASSRMVLNWEAGYSLPRPATLRQLISLFRQKGVFKTPEEALELWNSIKRSFEDKTTTSALYPVFDALWFNQTWGQSQPEPAASPAPSPDLLSFEKDRPANHNLPVSLTSFVGRELEIARLKEMFLNRPRLITLLGVGGVGKTRLALQVARQMHGHFKGEVWLVELAALSQENQVATEVANVLGVLEEPGKRLLESLVNHLKGKELLLILDNCEHLVEVCAKVASTLLQNCPGLCILATSRETLAIPGETIWIVPPLTLPPEEFEFNRPEALDDLSKYESIQLFLQRARAMMPGFRVSSQSAPYLIRICRFLEGIPLALELAASRVQTLSLAKIAGQLTGNERGPLKLLIEGNRVASPRHETLVALIDWSYNLLPPSEQILFQALSVFKGGWTIDAAEAVCGRIFLSFTHPAEESSPVSGPMAWLPNPDHLQPVNILDLLSRLVKKSLVTIELSDEEVEDVRYRMLETVRQFGEQKLAESGKQELCRQSHCEYYLDLFETAEPTLSAAGQEEWLNRLKRERDNALTALRWVTSRLTKSGFESSLKSANPEREIMLRLAGTLWRFWELWDYYSEAREWFEEIFVSPAILEQYSELSGKEPTRAMVKVLAGAGVIFSIQGSYSVGKGYAEQSLRLARELGDKGLIAYALHWLVEVEVILYLDELDGKESLLEESLALSRESGNAVGVATALLGLGAAASGLGEIERAKEYLQEALVLFRDLRDRQGQAGVLLELGIVMAYAGCLELSIIHLEESLELFKRLKRSRGISYALRSIGVVRFIGGKEQEALPLLQESLKLSIQAGDKRNISICLLFLGLIAGQQKQLHKAALLLATSRNMARKIGWQYPPAAIVLLEKFEPEVSNLINSQGIEHVSQVMEHMDLGEVVKQADSLGVP